MRFSWWFVGVRKLSRRERRQLKRGRTFTRPYLEPLEDCLAPNVSWTGGAGTLNWTDAANWSAGAVPTSTDDVTINTPVSGPIIINIGNAANQSIHSLTDTTASLSITGGTLSIAAASSDSQNLTLSGGTLSADNQLKIDGVFTELGGTLAGSGTMTVTGQGSWTGGTMTGTGHTVIAAGATLAVSGNNPLEFRGGRTLDNAGTVTWAYTGQLNTGEGTVWNNQAGALFDLQADFHSANVGGAVPQFNNAGTLRKSAGTGTNEFFDVPILNNTGTIEVRQGNLNLSGGGTLAFNGLNRLSTLPGTSLTVNGDLVGGTTNADQYNPLGTVVLQGGSVTSPRLLEVMSKDLGSTAAGFQRNFAYGSLQLTLPSYAWWITPTTLPAPAPRFFTRTTSSCRQDRLWI